MRLAEIEVVDTPLVKEAVELARTYSAPYLFNHVMRSWLFGVLAAEKAGAKVDPELMALAAVLHDLGLTEQFARADRFEVDGANAARSFLSGRGIGARDVQLVWDAIALHTTFSIAAHKEPEVALCCAGITIDIAGYGLEQIEPQRTAAILAAYPRLAVKEQLKDTLCAIARSKPQTTYDNFVRDIGERYLPGYSAPSFADLLQNAPFDE